MHALLCSASQHNMNTLFLITIFPFKDQYNILWKLKQCHNKLHVRMVMFLLIYLATYAPYSDISGGGDIGK